MKLFAVNDVGSHETVEKPQDVRFFQSPDEAARYYDDWFIDSPHLAIDSDGVQYRLQHSNKHLTFVTDVDKQIRPDLYRMFAESMLEYYFSNKLNVELRLQPVFSELSLLSLNSLVFALLMKR